jgi:hypothetical protein
MKLNNKSIALLLLLSVAIYVFFHFNSNAFNQQNDIHKKNNNYWMLNTIANYENSNTIIDESLILIREEKKKLKEIVGCEGSVVLFYPNHVCDVCDADIFALLNSYSDSILNSHLIALVPVQSYRDFYNFNQEYNINSILSYDGKIIQNQENINRGIFLYIGSDLKLSDLYIPRKPIISSEFQIYLKRILSKYNIDK